MVSLVVLNYNDSETTLNYIESIKTFSSISHIAVVDNHSTDDSFEKLQSFQNDNCDVIRTEKNGGYGSGNNFGVHFLQQKYNPDYIIISNPDVRYTEDVIKKMERILDKNEDISVIAPIMYRPNGNKDLFSAWKIPTGWQYALRTASIFNKFVKDFFYRSYKFENELMDVGAVAGSMFMVRTKDFLNVGGFDEKIFLYCEETVLGIKMRQAQKRVVLYDGKFTHYHSVTISKSIKKFKDREKMQWSSRKYVLRNYFNFNDCKMLIVNLVEKMTILTRSLIHAIKV